MDLGRISLLGFSALMNSLSEKERSSLLELLPAKEKDSFYQAPKLTIDLLFSDEIIQFLEAVHPSWLHFIFEKYSPKDQRILIHAFHSQYSTLLKLLNLQDDPLQLTAFSQQFIREKAYLQLINLKEGVDPIYAIHQEPFFTLLKIPAERWERFIIYLSLYDLKEEIKTLIDKNKLKTIQEYFSKSQLEFLKKIGKQKQAITFSPMGLQNWNGKIEEFVSILKTRGLNRLAKSLTYASESFCWHLFLLLAVDDAKILKKLMVTKIDPVVEKELELQLKEAYAFFQQHEEP